MQGARALVATLRRRSCIAEQEAALVDLTAVSLGFGILRVNVAERAIVRGVPGSRRCPASRSSRPPRARAGALPGAASPTAACNATSAQGATLGGLGSLSLWLAFESGGAPWLLRGAWLAPVVGALLGHCVRRFRCSNAHGRVTVAPRLDECPRCRSVFLGTLRHPPGVLAVGDAHGAAVYRVRSHFAGRGVAWSVAVSLAAAGAFVSPRFEVGPLLLALALGVVLGASVGSRVPRYFCSWRQCDAILEPFVRTCPRCLGHVRGDVTDIRESL